MPPCCSASECCSWKVCRLGVPSKTWLGPSIGWTNSFACSNSPRPPSKSLIMRTYPEHGRPLCLTADIFAGLEFEVCCTIFESHSNSLSILSPSPHPHASLLHPPLHPVDPLAGAAMSSIIPAIAFAAVGLLMSVGAATEPENQPVSTQLILPQLILPVPLLSPLPPQVRCDQQAQ